MRPESTLLISFLVTTIACSESENNPASSSSGSAGAPYAGGSTSAETGATSGGIGGVVETPALAGAASGGGAAADAGGEFDVAGGGQSGNASGRSGDAVSSTGGTGGSSGGASDEPPVAGSPASGNSSISLLNPAAIIVEDNFDAATASNPPDSSKWESYEAWASSFAPVVDAAKFHSAPNSVRIQSTNVGYGSFLVPKSGFPVEGNRFYVRVYINWEKATASIMGHSGFIVGATDRQNNGTEVRLGISNKGPGDEAMIDLNLIGGPGGEVTRYSNGFTDGGDPGQVSGNGFQFQADTWVCLEAFFNGGGNEFRVWADGAEIEAMHVTDFQGSPGGAPRTAWAPTYSVLKIGAQDYDANLGKIWYDDVVVARERVGCD